MKFNWGTGIFIFLTVFLLAAAVFIIFAFKQGVNLVHEDYYQKGADYTEQMEVDARSAEYYNAFKTYMNGGDFIVEFEEALALRIDSGMVTMYRPSDSDEDMRYSIESNERLIVPREDLISGRYILKMNWYADGLEYEVDKPVNIQ